MRRLFCTLLTLVAFAAPAFAHKLIVDPRLKEDRLYVEVFYEDETPAQQAKILVFNGDKVVAEGRTDDKGVWSCARPGPGSYVVKAESLGHVARETVVIANPDAVVLASDDTPESESDRASKTRTPWARVFIGLGVIGLLTILGLAFRKRGHDPSNPPT